MKSILKIFILILIFAANPVFSAANSDSIPVLVLPVDFEEKKENYYAFSEASEIFAQDIIKNFNKNGKINSPDLYEIRQKFTQNADIRNLTVNALKKYKTGNINYVSFAKISEEFSTNYVLIISSSVVTKETSVKRGIWEILDISSVFNISYPFKLETGALLIDTRNDIIMWSNVYTKNITNKAEYFTAQNYAQANAHLENLKMYSKDIISQDISQNIILRFFPKTINPIDIRSNDDNSAGGGALRFNKLIPQTKIDKKESNIGPDNYGDLIFEP